MVIETKAMATSKESQPGSHNISDSIITEFSTYEDFLDSQITSTDLYYLEVSCKQKGEYSK